MPDRLVFTFLTALFEGQFVPAYNGEVSGGEIWKFGNLETWKS